MTPTALPVLAVLLLSSTPDIVPIDMRGILVESRIDARLLAAEHCLGHVLQKGDTLLDLAKKHLGDEARWPEIAMLNPQVDRDKLRPGELVWLPPRDAAAKKKELVFAYVDTGRPLTRSVQPLVDAAAIEPSRYNRLGVFLVPESSHSAFRSAIAATEQGRRTPRTEPLQALVESGKVIDIDCTTPGRLVRTSDPTAKRADTYRFEKGVDGKFTLQVSSIAYDKNGKPIDPRAGGHDGEQKKQMLLLLLLAAAGGALLLQRARAHRHPLPAIA